MIIPSSKAVVKIIKCCTRCLVTSWLHLFLWPQPFLSLIEMAREALSWNALLSTAEDGNYKSEEGGRLTEDALSVSPWVWHWSCESLLGFSAVVLIFFPSFPLQPLPGIRPHTFCNNLLPGLSHGRPFSSSIIHVPVHSSGVFSTSYTKCGMWFLWAFTLYL